MKFLKATIVVRSGHPDNVSITTDLPSPLKCDEGTDTPLYLDFNCMGNDGEKYVNKHFPGIEINLIKVS